MIASELKKQFEQTPLISLFELSQRLQKDPMILKHLLQRWEAKGRVKQMPKTSACGTACSRCHPHMTVIYEYLG